MPDKLVVTVRDTPEGAVVAVCDPDCVGDSYEDGDVSLDVSESFYDGADAERLPPEEAMGRLGGATTANLVGERSVEAAIEAGVVDPNTVIEIDGTPHAQVVWL